MDLDGAVHLVLPPGVGHLDPESAVFEAMLAGWERQQRSRFLNAGTIGPRLRLIRRFAEFSGLYPWQWSPGEVEAFTSDWCRERCRWRIRRYGAISLMFGCSASS
jgi:integrase/recombinase XerD